MKVTVRYQLHNTELELVKQFLNWQGHTFELVRAGVGTVPRMRIPAVDEECVGLVGLVVAFRDRGFLLA